MTWSQTASGRQAFIREPERTEIVIEDIAAHLSRICRFNGALRSDIPIYTVAQHSVLVSIHCKPEHALIGLLHDAAEAYVQDLTRPLKHELRALHEPIERAWALRIGEVFGLGNALWELPDDVVRIDERLLATEKRDLMAPCEAWRAAGKPLDVVITPWDPIAARGLFLSQFQLLTGAL